LALKCTGMGWQVGATEKGLYRAKEKGHIYI